MCETVNYIYYYYCDTDIDECENDGLNSCHEDASCTNTEGSFDCHCNDGYSGNGTECTGKKIATSSYIRPTYSCKRLIPALGYVFSLIPRSIKKSQRKGPGIHCLCMCLAK